MKVMITNDGHCIYAEIQGTLNISSATIHKILYEKLEIRKLISRWIPHLLNDNQKQARIDWCPNMLDNLDNGTSLAVSNITADEMSICCYEAKNKQKS